MMKARVKDWLVTAWVVVMLALVTALAGMVVAAEADGPVLWKQHCPRWHELVFWENGAWQVGEAFRRWNRLDTLLAHVRQYYGLRRGEYELSVTQ